MLFRVYLTVFLLAVSGSVFAQTGSSRRPPRVTATEFSISTLMSRQSGYTKYQLNISDAETRVISELDFPLDHLMIGGRAILKLIGQGTPLWQFEAYVSRSLNAPNGLMTDSDWSYSTINYYSGLWSYTESIPEGYQWDFGVAATYNLINRPSHAVGLTAGIRQQKIHQDIDNFEGYQLIGPARDRYEFDESNLPALTYDVSYVMPEIGLSGNLRIADILWLNPRVVYSFVHASDRDYHLLRKKTTKASGNGKAVSLNLNSELQLPLMLLGRPVHVMSDFSVLSLRVDAFQTQRFYETVEVYDPIERQYYVIPEGTVFGAIPYQFHSTQLAFGLRLSLAL